MRLRSHQWEAVEAIVRALTPRPDRLVPGGLRATVQMATGTGKGFVGAAADQRPAPHGTVPVVVPTLDLLVQMVDSWRAAGRKGDMAAVCSFEPGELPHGVPGSTHPLVIGRWIAKRPRPLTLFTTYASAGAIADAYMEAAMPARSKCSARANAVYCDPASEWCVNSPCRDRVPVRSRGRSAVSSVARTSSVCLVVAANRPTVRREKVSTTNAT